MPRLLAAAVLAALVSGVGTARLTSILRRRGVLDLPGERSSHDAPRPRGGGLAIAAGLGVGLAVALPPAQLAPLGALAAALVLVGAAGWLDDVRGGAPIGLRLAVQTVAAGLVVVSWGPISQLPLPAPVDLPLGGWAWPLSLLWLVGVTNLTNFLDGIDGYAGAQSVLAGAGAAILGLATSDPLWTAWGVVLAAACLGFLPRNWAPSEIFLGDVGSSILGFGIAAMALSPGGLGSGQKVLVTAVLLWPFLADGCLTLARRALRGETLWSAHREHLYQRLVATGLPHDRVVVGLLAPSLLPGALLVVASARAEDWIAWSGLALALASTGATWYAVVRRESTHLQSG